MCQTAQLMVIARNLGLKFARRTTIPILPKCYHKFNAQCLRRLCSELPFGCFSHPSFGPRKDWRLREAIALGKDVCYLAREKRLIGNSCRRNYTRIRQWCRVERLTLGPPACCQQLLATMDDLHLRLLNVRKAF
jgi:hypothetical protein